MTARTEQRTAETEAEERVRSIRDAAITLGVGLIQQECKPIEVAGGLLSASMDIFVSLSSRDEVRRLLYRMGDVLIGGDA